jgi:phosphoenolpyruvate carboxykinase (GTP)
VFVLSTANDGGEHVAGRLSYEIKKAGHMPHTKNRALTGWVVEFANRSQAADVRWCNGSADEYDELCQLLVSQGTFTKLSDAKRPASYWAHSDPRDVARVESRTFVCPTHEIDAGPNNNWMDPAAMRDLMNGLFDGAMEGRTLYVVPFSMGPLDSPIAKIGVQLTDSPYVVVSLRIMTRMGDAVLEALGDDGAFVPCLHSVGVPLANGAEDVSWPCDPEHLTIAHFPET